jgi:coenzyme F420-reducing hydrogenase gamma subunit
LNLAAIWAIWHSGLFLSAGTCAQVGGRKKTRKGKEKENKIKQSKKEKTKKRRTSE